MLISSKQEAWKIKQTMTMMMMTTTTIATINEYKKSNFLINHADSGGNTKDVLSNNSLIKPERFKDIKNKRNPCQ